MKRAQIRAGCNVGCLVAGGMMWPKALQVAARPWHAWAPTTHPRFFSLFAPVFLAEQQPPAGLGVSDFSWTVGLAQQQAVRHISAVVHPHP